MIEPHASRPYAPGYGLPPEADGTWPWPWAQALLRRAQRYLLATTRADGRPHLMPVWAVWHDGALWFSTGAGSAKHRNLSARPRCSIAAEDGPHTVVLEGTAARTELPTGVSRAYEDKYAEPMPPGEPVYRLAPEVAFGLSDAAGEFAKATRWSFPSF